MLPHDETIMAGCFVPGTPWVITGGHDGKIKFWDRNTGMMIRPPIGETTTFSRNANGVGVNAVGQLIARTELPLPLNRQQ